MSKWASVTVLTSVQVAVEIEDGETLEDAQTYAIDEISFGDGVYETGDSYFVESEHEQKQLARLADKVMPL